MENETANAKTEESIEVDQHYAVRNVPHKGVGLVALSRIPKGTRILSEAPILKVPRTTSDFRILDDTIVKQLKELDKEQQRAFFSLHNAHGKQHSPCLSIARTNVLPLGSEAL